MQNKSLIEKRKRKQQKHKMQNKSLTGKKERKQQKPKMQNKSLTGKTQKNMQNKGPADRKQQGKYAKKECQVCCMSKCQAEGDDSRQGDERTASHEKLTTSKD